MEAKSTNFGKYW